MTLSTFDLVAFLAAKGEDRRKRARQIDEICRETGFLVL